MKIIAINASPRKGWNTEQMLDAFLDGVRAHSPDAKIEKVQLYQLDFKGCRGCLACQMKATENGQCLFKDGATDLIRAIKSADGFVFAAPIYYFEVPSQMRAVLERLFYPGGVDREIPVTCIYTMNQPEQNMERFFKKHLDDISMHLRHTFQSQPDVVCAFETLHWQHPERYQFPLELYEKRSQAHETQFSSELENARNAGKRMAEKINF